MTRPKGRVEGPNLRLENGKGSRPIRSCPEPEYSTKRMPGKPGRPSVHRVDSEWARETTIDPALKLAPLWRVPKRRPSFLYSPRCAPASRPPFADNTG